MVKGSHRDEQLARTWMELLDREAIERAGREVGWSERKRLIGPSEFTNGMVFGAFGTRQASYADQAAGMAAGGETQVTAQAVYNRVKRGGADLMVAALGEVQRKHWAMSRRKGSSGILSKFPAVWATDSSTVSLPKELAGVLPGSGGTKRTEAGLKWHLTLDVLGATPECWTFTAAREADDVVDEVLTAARKETLHLVDKGYSQSPGRLGKIHRAGQYFLTPLWLHLPLYDEGGRKLDVLKLVRRKTTLNQIVYIGNPQKENLDVTPVRLVGVRVPPDVANQRRRRARADARRKGKTITKRRLNAQDWCLWITNTSSEQLPPEEIPAVYGLRWQIELAFKRWKSLLGMRKPPYRTAASLICHLCASLIAMLLLAYAQQPAWSQWTPTSPEPSPYRMASLLSRMGTALQALFALSRTSPDALLALHLLLSTVQRFAVHERRRRPTARARCLAYQHIAPL